MGVAAPQVSQRKERLTTSGQAPPACADLQLPGDELTGQVPQGAGGQIY